MDIAGQRVRLFRNKECGYLRGGCGYSRTGCGYSGTKGVVIQSKGVVILRQVTSRGASTEGLIMGSSD